MIYLFPIFSPTKAPKSDPWKLNMAYGIDGCIEQLFKGLQINPNSRKEISSLIFWIILFEWLLR